MCKKLLFILLFACCAIGSMAQNLEIKQDFKISENSSAAIMYHNQFGQYEKPAMDDTFPYAVVRVLLEGNAHEVTEAKKMLGIYTGVLSQGVKASYLDFENEILFLVPSSSGHVELSCGEGCARQTILELPRLQSNAVYVGKVHYTPAAAVPEYTPNKKKQTFIFEVTPRNAIVEVLVNGKRELCQIDEDIHRMTLYHGTYSYYVSAPRYQNEEGTITVSDSSRTKTVKLLPKYGWLSLTATEANNGASVYATNIKTGERIVLGNIPVAPHELDPGEYQLQILQSKYKSYTKNITILANDTLIESPILEPNFKRLTLTTDEQSEIYVNGELYGKGSWTGTLELGEYSIETRKANHRSSYTTLNVSDSDTNQKIQLKAPLPIIGSLSVDGSPVRAAIYVDDKYVGESPMIVNDLLIGEHQIKVDKDGYAVWKKMVTVAENEEGVVTYELEKGISLDRVALEGLNVTNLSVKREGGETFVFTFDLPKKGPVRLKMSTDGHTYVDQKNVKGAVGKEIDKGEGYQIAWTIPEDLGQATRDSLYFQIVVLPELPKEKIKIGSLYYQAVDDGTSVEVAIGEYNFTGVDIPSKIKYKGYEYPVTGIGWWAFKDCKNLTSITIPGSVTSIGKSAFENCEKLISITIPNSVTSIGSQAFCNCRALRSITIPNSVTSIGGQAFASCDKLTSITIPNNVTSIGDKAFSYCSTLSSITIPNSVTSIGAAAFWYCSNLSSITIPNSVTSIGEGAFWYCSNLTSITIPNSVTSIGLGAFNDCKKLKTIYIPRGTKAKFAAMEGLKKHVDKLVEIL